MISIFRFSTAEDAEDAEEEGGITAVRDVPPLSGRFVELLLNVSLCDLCVLCGGTPPTPSRIGRVRFAAVSHPE